jgi:hypothetical protein
MDEFLLSLEFHVSCLVISTIFLKQQKTLLEGSSQGSGRGGGKMQMKVISI